MSLPKIVTSIETFIIRYTPVDYRECRMRAVSFANMGEPGEEKKENRCSSRCRLRTGEVLFFFFDRDQR